MLVTDSEIEQLINDGVLKRCDKKRILSIGYDLRTQAFYNVEKEYFGIKKLDPGDSIFVECIEMVELPEDIIAIIQLRNGRIRQGLTLDAPVYQPGHKTLLYYRITNISKTTIGLSTDDGIAYVMFYKLGSIPQRLYDGEFQNEVSEFFGMAGYSELFRSEMSEVKDFCFLVMPFGEEWSDAIHDLVKEVGEENDIDILRADDIYGIRPIMHDVAASIEKARVVIAVMTGRNANVNYEIGLAHAWGKPSIMIASSMEDIPFDYRHLRVITYNERMPTWGRKLKRDLSNTIKSIFDEDIKGYNYFDPYHL